MLAGAAAAGASDQDIWKKSGLHDQEDRALRRGLDVPGYVHLSRAVTTTINDEFMGLANRPQPIGVFALVAAHASHARTVGDAGTRIAHFFDLMDNSFRFSFVEKSQEGQFRIGRIPGHRIHNELLPETILLTVHRLIAWLGGQYEAISQVWFDYSRPGHAGVYEQFFLGAMATFDRDSCGFSISGKTLGRPILRTEAQAMTWARRTPLDALMPVQVNSPLAMDISSVIENHLERHASLPSLRETAASLHLADYTLRRRLKREGGDYLRLRSQIRRDLAIRLLNSTLDPIEEIARRVGYSEASAFVRAFKMWTGLSPGVYRRGEG
ncbi:MAG: AraC family transcriptional regulator ligand-binding domain-containing protein [Nitratireductor sp.]|nr:AraC family transcriptional regulator ligand-binding domain-containing protein [Nitratireductor sp.]